MVKFSAVIMNREKNFRLTFSPRSHAHNTDGNFNTSKELRGIGKVGTRKEQPMDWGGLEVTGETQDLDQGKQSHWHKTLRKRRNRNED